MGAGGRRQLHLHNCLWVSGSFAGKGHGRALLEACVTDAKAQGRSGVCVLSAKKKTPFLSDKKFLLHFGFTVADAVGDYELLSLSFDGSLPRFADNARKLATDIPGLAVYYSPQCPYAANCIEQIADYCQQNGIAFHPVPVQSLEEAKAVPGVFNNWAVFLDGRFQTVHLLNGNLLKKLLRQ